jgi:hypothetical protein
METVVNPSGWADLPPGEKQARLLDGRVSNRARLLAHLVPTRCRHERFPYKKHG